VGSSTPPSSQVDHKQKMVLAYYQAKTCNVLAAVFAVCGLFLFALLFQRHIAPDPVAALRSISTLGIIVFPFFPAVLLSFVAKRYEKRYLAMLDKPPTS
jgi:uncharacterized membrane protein